MKTIQQAIIDEIHYPIGSGIVENIIIKRALTPDAEYTTAVANSNDYKGAIADCLYSLIDAPNFSEAGKSISLGDKALIIKKVNSLYNEIGEPTRGEDKPKVYAGWRYLHSKKTNSTNS